MMLQEQRQYCLGLWGLMTNHELNPVLQKVEDVMSAEEIPDKCHPR